MQTYPAISKTIVKGDIDRLIWSGQLRNVTRFFKQRYWEKETDREIRRRSLLGAFSLENVAEHSWHLSDAVIVIAPRFPGLDVGRAVSLATLHDLLEILTGDFDPVGTGAGLDTHAFSVSKSLSKVQKERQALSSLECQFRSCNDIQFKLIREYLDLPSEEAKFVKALDKIQAALLVFDYKKESQIEAGHVEFARDYCGTQVRSHFPALMPYLDVVLGLLEEAYPVVPGRPKCGILTRMGCRNGGYDGTADGQGAIAYRIPGGVSRRGGLRGIFARTALA